MNSIPSSMRRRSKDDAQHKRVAGTAEQESCSRLFEARLLLGSAFPRSLGLSSLSFAHSNIYSTLYNSISTFFTSSRRGTRQAEK